MKKQNTTPATANTSNNQPKASKPRQPRKHQNTPKAEQQPAEVVEQPAPAVVVEQPKAKQPRKPKATKPATQPAEVVEQPAAGATSAEQREATAAEYKGLAKAGAAIDRQRATAKGLCKDVANDIAQHGTASDYFRQVYTAYLHQFRTAEAVAAIAPKGEAESAADYLKRVAAAQRAAVAEIMAQTTPATLANSAIYKVMSSPRKAYGLLLSRCACYYTTEGVRTFAKVATIARALSSYTAAELAAAKEGKSFAITTWGGVEYVTTTKAAAELLATTSPTDKITSRRADNDPLEQQPAIWEEGGKLRTLKATDRANFAQLVPVLAWASMHRVDSKFIVSATDTKAEQAASEYQAAQVVAAAKRAAAESERVAAGVSLAEVAEGEQNTTSKPQPTKQPKAKQHPRKGGLLSRIASALVG